MRRVLVGCLSAALGLGAVGRAEDVVWRRAAQPTAATPSPVPTAVQPAVRVVPAAPVPRVLAAAAVRQPAPQPARIDVPNATPLGPPRTAENPIPGASQWSPNRPADDPGPMFNLVSESADRFGPPIDPGQRLYLKAELLLWWYRGINAPALVATAGLPPPPVFTGFQNPQVLVGNGQVGGNFAPGARFSAGLWLNGCQTCGIDGSLFFLSRRDRIRTDSVVNNVPVIIRPIFSPNLVNGVPIGETQEVAAFPPGFVLPGTDQFFPGRPVADQSAIVDVTTGTTLWGADVNIKEALKACGGCNGGYRIDLFAGFRHLGLSEFLRVNEIVTLGANDLFARPPGTGLFLEDFFGTRNLFYGGQLGVAAEWRRNRLFAEVRQSVALGGTYQNLRIDGFLLETPPGGPTTAFAGGLLALPGANIGTYERGRLSFVTETTVNVGVQLRPWLRAFAGYNFLYWNGVMRPGDQIDRVIDITRIPRFLPPPVLATIPPLNPPRPAVAFRQSDFWAQGVNLGLQLRY